MRIIREQLGLHIAAGDAVGKIRPKRAREIGISPVGIGLEKADEGLYAPETAISQIDEAGVKWVRIQSGWARCERERGSYDYGWLDRIVDGIAENGALPWMCLCYGNSLYDDIAPSGSRACGLPPLSEPALKAWLEYVRRTVARYRGRILYYEIWNEPDGRHCWKSGVDGTEYGKFVIKTAEVIRREDPDSKILAGSMCNLVRLRRFCDDGGILFDGEERVSGFFKDWLSTGAGKEVDFVTVHLYRKDPEAYADELYEYIREMLSRYGSRAGIIQGETGAPAAFGRAGALNCFEWTERKQAKFLLRRLYTDIVHGAFFTSYFSFLDMYESHENIPAVLTKDKFGFFGVLGAEFDGDGNFTGRYYRRLSFYALQMLCTVFADGTKKCREREFCFVCLSNAYWGGGDVGNDGDEEKQLHGDTFCLPDGKKFEVYYLAAPLVSAEYNGSVSVVVKRVLKKPAVADLLNGWIYPVKEENIRTENGCTTLFRLPLRDYPWLLFDLESTGFSIEPVESTEGYA